MMNYLNFQTPRSQYTLSYGHGPAYQPLNTTLDNPRPMELFSRPEPNSFGLMNIPVTPPVYPLAPTVFTPYPTVPNPPLFNTQVSRTWFTGFWPVLSTQYAIENYLIPEPPNYLEYHPIPQDPMDVDGPELPIAPESPKKKPKKRIAPTNISSIPTIRSALFRY